MIRVMQVLPDFGPGGAERVAAGLLMHLDASEFSVSAASLYPFRGSGIDDELRRRGVPVTYLGKRRGPDPRMYARMSDVLTRFRPHVVHTHLYVLRYLLPVMLMHRVPVMVHTVHTLAEREIEPHARWISRVAWRAGVTPVTIARAVDASFERLYGFKAPAMIPNGIHVAAYAEAAVPREVWRSAHGFQPDETVYLCVGRLVVQKNHALLLRAFARSAEAHANARLAIIGEGEQRAALEAQAAALGIAARVRFLGIRRDVPDAMAAADAFVLPSDYEGNPLSVMEAMAAGLPVVATAVGGVPELVEDGRHGFLVPAGDADALAGAMSRLAADGGMRATMALHARERAAREFGVQQMAEAYANLYRRLVSRREQPAELAATP